MLWERVLANFHECFYNSIETRRTCFLFLLEKKLISVYRNTTLTSPLKKRASIFLKSAGLRIFYSCDTHFYLASENNYYNKKLTLKTVNFPVNKEYFVKKKIVKVMAT